ncbi:MAG TPA: hypothetical protein VIX91_14765, partial [Candidatus Acidoferrum sp.]
MDMAREVLPTPGGPTKQRIEHFEQRGGRIAAEVHRHFVDFVEHEDRILGAGLLHHLDDLAGKSA